MRRRLAKTKNGEEKDEEVDLGGERSREVKEEDEDLPEAG